MNLAASRGSGTNLGWARHNCHPSASMTVASLPVAYSSEIISIAIPPRAYCHECIQRFALKASRIALPLFSEERLSCLDLGDSELAQLERREEQPRVPHGSMPSPRSFGGIEAVSVLVSPLTSICSSQLQRASMPNQKFTDKFPLSSQTKASTMSSQAFHRTPRLTLHSRSCASSCTYGCYSYAMPVAWQLRCDRTTSGQPRVTDGPRDLDC